MKFHGVVIVGVPTQRGVGGVARLLCMCVGGFAILPPLLLCCCWQQCSAFRAGQLESGSCWPGATLAYALLLAEHCLKSWVPG